MQQWQNRRIDSCCHQAVMRQLQHPLRPLLCNASRAMGNVTRGRRNNRGMLISIMRVPEQHLRRRELNEQILVLVDRHLELEHLVVRCERPLAAARQRLRCIVVRSVGQIFGWHHRRYAASLFDLCAGNGGKREKNERSRY